MWPMVPHYHGDIVRQLFVTGAIAMLLSAPFYTENLRAELPFIIFGALAAIAAAALTSPHKRTFVTVDVVAAALIAIIYESWALFDYESSTWPEFALRQLIAIVFMVAFYFSMKTLRAMFLGKVGKSEEVGEFDDNA